MQRPGRVALPAVIVGSLSLTPGMIAIEKRPGLNVRIDLVDALNAIGDKLGRRDAARVDFGRRVLE
jgi:hypothetical protein